MFWTCGVDGGDVTIVVGANVEVVGLNVDMDEE